MQAFYQPGNSPILRPVTGGQNTGAVFLYFKKVFKENVTAQVRKFLPVRKIINVFQILLVQEKSGYHTLQSSGTKCQAANIGLAAIAVLVVD